MEAAIRFSQNSAPVGSNTEQRFLHVDVSGKHFQLCRIISRRSKRTLKYETVATSGPKVPAFRAFDWHPTHEHIVAVGQAGGEATLLNLHSPAHYESPQDRSPITGLATGVDSISFNVRSQRPSNAVSLSSQNLLAAGLDRVRTDFCLNVWDFTQRIPSSAPSASSSSEQRPLSFTKSPTSHTPEPLHKLAPGEPITSLKFFQDSPSLLVAGVKGQFVRLYDLRDPASISPSSSIAVSAGASVGGGLQFPTRCVHNLAIDWRDENYFASCFPTGDTQVCLWDRRMSARAVSTSMSFGSSSDDRHPEVSLELKNAIDSPGAIWSLRFAKFKRGCLGVLSSTGHLKVYNVGKDFDGQTETYRVDETTANSSQGKRDEQQPAWTTQSTQDVYLDRAQDIERHYAHPSALRDEKARVVSFDFTTTSTKMAQPEIISLAGDGEIKITSPAPIPEPAGISSTGFFTKGNNRYVQESNFASDAGHEKASAVKSIHAQTQIGGQALANDGSSLASNLQQTDLGIDKSESASTTLPNLLALTSVARHRCRAGYLLSPAINRDIVSEDRSLSSLWTWIERAQRMSKGNGMVQDNLDLAYLGVYGLWMEEIPESAMRVRTLGPGPPLSGGKKVSKAIEGLIRRLNVPVNRGTHTHYKLNRQLCLHVSGLSWSSNELETWTSKLAERGQHSKAAFVALVASERTLALKTLRAKNTDQRERMLGVAIAGAVKRAKKVFPSQSKKIKEEESDSGSDFGSTDDDDWSSTITSLSEDLKDPYARAILAYVKSNDWSDVLKEETLPLKYRVCVALRHLDDGKLSKYVSQATEEAMAEGNIEGIVLTGTGTREGFELMEKYMARFGDLQSAVLALASIIPRYVNDDVVLRKFDAWKQAYRGAMNSWGCRMERVRFDIAVQKVAIENGPGRRLAKPGKPQVKLVCSYCAGSVAHHDAENGDAEEGSGTRYHDTAKNPLTPATAAAMGIVCPKCERKLPRCGVCDMWLGAEDKSYLPWFGEQRKTAAHSAGSIDLSGSAHTVIGPLHGGDKRKTDSPAASMTMAGSKKNSSGSNEAKVKPSKQELNKLLNNSALDTTPAEDTPEGRAKKQDDMMARLTVFCVKCSHAFHAVHARMWFQGSPEEGRNGHKVCPVPRCQCTCYA